MSNVSFSQLLSKRKSGLHSLNQLLCGIVNQSPTLERLGGNINHFAVSKTFADGKQAYTKKKKIDKMLERRENDPLKDIQDIFQVGHQLATKKPRPSE